MRNRTREICTSGRAAVARWPAARITLRQGIRVVHDTGPLLKSVISAMAGDGLLGRVPKV